jgi:hypothetical protein
MIAAIVMVGGTGGETEAVGWVQNAQRQSAFDLLEQLEDHPGINQRILVTPTMDGLEDAPITDHVESQDGRIHVGQTLAEIVERNKITKLLYFGGGSAPLLDDRTLDSIVVKMQNTQNGVFTNNQYASDWAGITPATAVTQWRERLPLDNMIGWVLSTEADLKSHSLPPSPASRVDIDTPADMLTLKIHPRTKQKLGQFLETLPLDATQLDEGLKVLQTSASHVFISGRISPYVWSALNEVTSCWIRVISEERGMVSSGRQARGEVYSMLAEHISKVGMRDFFDTLSEISQAAFIDTRVLLAHRRIWPSRGDRFLSDLGSAAEIDDPWLNEFTFLAREAPIPIILGGHGLLSGDMLALAEILSINRDQPEYD